VVAQHKVGAVAADVGERAEAIALQLEQPVVDDEHDLPLAEGGCLVGRVKARLV